MEHFLKIYLPSFKIYYTLHINAGGSFLRFFIKSYLGDRSCIYASSSSTSVIGSYIFHLSAPTPNGGFITANFGSSSSGLIILCAIVWCITLYEPGAGFKFGIVKSYIFGTWLKKDGEPLDSRFFFSSSILSYEPGPGICVFVSLNLYSFTPN